jgi:hypothetical protein
MSRVDCGKNCGVTVHPNPNVGESLADQDGIGISRLWRFERLLEFRCFVTYHTPSVDTNEVISK